LEADATKIAMTNEYYKPGEDRAARVGQLFASIARRYDLINDIQSFGLHRRWKKRVLNLTRVQPGQRALDLCCGTGDITFALAAKGAEATGLDFSEPMLEVAREKAARLNPNDAAKSPAARTQFIHGDAQQIPFPANAFDVVTIGYGLRNLADLDTGLRDMLRVTRPGGRFVALEFGKPANGLWRAIYFGYLKFMLPIFGKLFCGNSAAYAYILESLSHYPAQEGVAEKLAQLGWRNIRVIDLLGGVMSIHYAEKPR
jgi:demethylmenaquinone methyltransferase/2-methoxy-6-polyprenyl-1,4-benzoquinol methylase